MSQHFTAGNPLSDDAILQIAQRLFDACEPATAALKTLENAIPKSKVLREQLETTLEAAQFPVQANQVVEVFEKQIKKGRPSIPGLNPHRA